MAIACAGPSGTPTRCRTPSAGWPGSRGTGVAYSNHYGTSSLDGVFVAEAGGTIFEMGDEASAGATLRVTRPSLPPEFPQDPPPQITMRILRAAAGGGVEVASGSDATLEYTTTEPGAYRVEVRMTPEHARPFLGSRAERLIREIVWVYSNAVFVSAP